MTNTTINQHFQRLIRLLELEAEAEKQEALRDMQRRSPAAAEREIGWRARFDFETGMRHTTAWFRDNPERLAFYTSRIPGA